MRSEAHFMHAIIKSLLDDVPNLDHRDLLTKRIVRISEPSAGEMIFRNNNNHLKYNDYLEILAVDKTVDKPWTSYLPLEMMKSEHWLQLWAAVPPYRHFRSSGSSLRERSLSPFSQAGLQLYRAAGIADFYQVLRTLVPEPRDVMTIPGISLIPTCREWPESSLAFMLEQFSQHWDVSYQNLETIIDYLEKQHDPSQPLWIFGTALHYIGLLEQYPQFAKALPKRSYLFETGGSKSSWRRWSHPVFIQWLRQHLVHSEQMIISEYGMCELACQAYGVWQGNDQIRLSFAEDVQCRIMIPGGKLANEGVGALTIFDPMRIDLPFLLRTQDIVHMQADGSFEILERVPHAVLKGCSLQVSELPPSIQTSEKTASHLTESSRIHGPKAGFQPLVLLEHFLASSQAWQALKLETGLSESLAKKDLQGLINSLPKDDTQRQSWLKQSIDNQGNFLLQDHLRGLFLAPKNHSLALIEALTAALCLSHRVSVRLPSTIGLVEGSQSLLALLLEYWLQHDVDIHRTADHLRISPGLPIDAAYVYLHGEDASIKKLKSMLQIPLFGFGSAITVAAITPDELLKHSEELIISMLHLGQLGCESLRAVLCQLPTDNFVKSEFMLRASQKLQEEFQRLMPSELAIKWQLSLDHAQLALKKSGQLFAGPVDVKRGPLIPFTEIKNVEDWDQHLQSYLYTLPIIFYKSKTAGFRDGFTQSGSYVYWLTFDKQAHHSPITQSKPWDGRHQGCALYHQH